MQVLIDTNVLVRRIHRADAQHRQARIALNRLIAGNHQLCVTSQNLIELWSVCTRPEDVNGLSLSHAQADAVLSRVEGAVYRLPDSDAVYPVWRDLVKRYGISGKKSHDARLVAVMIVHRVTHVLTFNVGDFKRFSEIQAMEPGIG